MRPDPAGSMVGRNGRRAVLVPRLPKQHHKQVAENCRNDGVAARGRRQGQTLQAPLPGSGAAASLGPPECRCITPSPIPTCCLPCLHPDFPLARGHRHAGVGPACNLVLTRSPL